MKRRLVAILLAGLMVAPTMSVSACENVGNGCVQISYEGETLWDVGNQLGANYTDIMAWNGMTDETVHVGDILWVGEFADCGSNYSESYDTYEESYTYDDCSTSYNAGELIGSSCLGVYSYGNSGYNISLACGNVNGYTIPSGGYFSAFATIGAGSAEEGYLASNVLFGDEVVEGYGGGICAVTTGLFQAGRNAGLVVCEGGCDHSLNCAYAESGDQSMFNYPTNNLVFYNPYDYPVSLWCGYYDGVLYCEVYAE